MAPKSEAEINGEAGGGGGHGKAGFDGHGKAGFGFPGADFGLRVLLFMASFSALIVLVTSKQKVAIPVFLQPQSPIFVTITAKFTQSPAFVYLLVALSLTALYSLITLLASASFLSKKAPSSKLLFRLLVLDLLMAAIMASATGAGLSVAYIGMKGNKHVMWNKVCNIFGKFCRQVGIAAGLSLVVSIALLLLVIFSSYTIYRRSG